MMRLMVEEMHDGPPERRLLRLSAAHENKRCSEPLFGQPRDPARKLIIRERALPAKLVEVAVQLLVERADAVGAHEAIRNADTRKAAEPHAIGEQQVVER